MDKPIIEMPRIMLISITIRRFFLLGKVRYYGDYQVTFTNQRN